MDVVGELEVVTAVECIISESLLLVEIEIVLVDEYRPIVDDEIKPVNVWLVCGLLPLVRVDLVGE